MRHGVASYRVFAVVLLGLVLALPQRIFASSGKDVPSSSAFATAWTEIDKLVAVDRLAEALPRVEKLLAEARTAGDEEMWTRALVLAARLRTSLSKPEDAARFLKEQPRPAGSFHRAVIDLYYAETLVRYSQVYYGEIGQREKVGSEGDLPLEQQTREQIATAALAAGRDAWSRRQELGDLPLSRLELYVKPNGYPAAIRGTARDALSYLYAELLALAW